VADLPIEEFQRRQASQISQDIAGQIDAHEQHSQTIRQQRWEIAHTHLVTLLRTLDQDYDEACTKAKRPLESFNDDDLAYLIQVRMRAIQEGSRRMENPGELLEAKSKLAALGQKYAGLEEKVSSLQDTNKKLLAEKDALEAHLTALRQVQLNPCAEEIASPLEVPSALQHVPDWIKAWQESKHFEKTSNAILVMGETGQALRPSIIKQMARRLSLSEENYSLEEAINRLLKPGETSIFPALIEEIEGLPKQGSSSGGNPPDVLRLTAEGLAAFRGLAGKDARENLYDALLRSHVSPEHTILNIQAAEVLEEAGYQVKSLVQQIHLSNGGKFIPDLTLTDPNTGEILFVEVEHDAHKNRQARKQKWINFYEASNGNLYVFCDNLTCQRAVQEEINTTLGDLNFNSFLTNLHSLREKKRSKIDGSVWLSMRKG
jgi:hypothetical protein